MPLILTLRGEVWLLWGVLATFNTAFIGWLLAKPDAFGNQQKTVATIGYLLFCLIMVIGFVGTYKNLDAAVTDLNAALRESGKLPEAGGLVEELSTRHYRNYLVYAISVTGLSFAFNMSLVWTGWF